MNKPLHTADDILACARSLIVAGGYNGFSYADIAEVVGIRKPSIHHHFPSRADLVKTHVIRYREAAAAGIADLARAVLRMRLAGQRIAGLPAFARHGRIQSGACIGLMSFSFMLLVPGTNDAAAPFESLNCAWSQVRFASTAFQ